ncbi:MAG: CDP-diacylglycerol--glycerol-3-phosphate 3-phosphatidyltransferase [Acidimicrobiales bacterium]
MASGSFGPTALVTPANGITIGRIAVTPILLAVILGGGDSWPAIALWTVLSGTDWVDGYLARRQGVTRSGAFLDPLADKFLVLGALVALVARGVFWWVPVAVIAGREVAISVYRGVAGRNGISVPARWWAKVKTVVQQVAVAFALLPLTATDHRVLAEACLWASLVLALVTGTQYLLDARKVEAAARSAG